MQYSAHFVVVGLVLRELFFKVLKSLHGILLQLHQDLFLLEEKGGVGRHGVNDNLFGHTALVRLGFLVERLRPFLR